MILSWLTGKAFGLSRGIWMLAAVAALIGAWLWLDARERADDQRNQDIGATVERERTTTATIKQVERANEAANDLRRNDGAAYDDCMRNARNQANC